MFLFEIMEYWLIRTLIIIVNSLSVFSFQYKTPLPCNICDKYYHMYCKKNNSTVSSKVLTKQVLVPVLVDFLELVFIFI